MTKNRVEAVFLSTKLFCHFEVEPRQTPASLAKTVILKPLLSFFYICENELRIYSDTSPVAHAGELPGALSVRYNVCGSLVWRPAVCFDSRPRRVLAFL